MHISGVAAIEEVSLYGNANLSIILPLIFVVFLDEINSQIGRKPHRERKKNKKIYLRPHKLSMITCIDWHIHGI